MISQLRGTLKEKLPPEIVLDVAGVGYELLCPMTTFYQLPELGKEVLLHTHLSIREDAHVLFGFAAKADRALFRELIKVNGIGPKLALSILSGMELADFVRRVHEGEVSALTKIPGVGKKTAERLVVEMKDKLKDWEYFTGRPQLMNLSQPAVASADEPVQEAVAALVALGYKPQDASKAIAKIEQAGMKSEELIRAALKAMVK
ncbi:MAG: Holliday junction branch migration protein RuvA [Gammaproteobacteria bacterium]|nr:Holliday junction branch migration protein RuvA [Gammaproteobacteria bacterium]